MYWSRTESILDLLIWLALCGPWLIGGWLLSTHAFRLRARERLFAGIAMGWLLFIVVSNILAQALPLTLAYWSTSLLILACGLFAGWRSRAANGAKSMPRPWLYLQDLYDWPQILAFLGLFILFTLINHGLALFDDYFNLPVVSMIAIEDVPPHFHLNPERLLDYHYGLHLFAASLVRIGGLFPWSAFDLTRTLSIALAIMLAWLWLYRLFGGKKLRNQVALFVGILLIVFGGGTRWLLLFLPETTLNQLGAGLQLIGSGLQTGPDLSTALQSSWNIDSGGPFPFPFAFVNGIFSPLTLQMSGVAAMPQLTMFLLLLLARPRWKMFPGLIFGLLLASLALTAEHIFLLLWGGILLSLLINAWSRRSFNISWGWVLIPSAILAVTAGGVLTVIANQVVSRFIGQQADTGISLSGAQVRWPPAVVSAHLGTLLVSDPAQLLLALLEMGPVLLLAPWSLWISWKRARQNRPVLAGLGLGALVSFAAPLLIQLTAKDRDVSRLTGSALFIWMALGFPALWLTFQKSRRVVKWIISAGIVLTLVSGMALLPVELIAISRPQLSDFIQEPDALMSKAFWNRLEPGVHIFDPHYPYRPAALFSRTTGPANWNVHVELPEFHALFLNPDPLQIAHAGYQYIYLDRETWSKMPPSLRELYQHDCIKLVKEYKTKVGDFRRLLDINACQAIP